MEKLAKVLRELEKSKGVIVKIEIFTDFTGDLYYVIEGENTFRYGFSFVGIDNLIDRAKEFIKN